MSVDRMKDGTTTHTDVPDGVMSRAQLMDWMTDHKNSAIDSSVVGPKQLGIRNAEEPPREEKEKIPN